MLLRTVARNFVVNQVRSFSVSESLNIKIAVCGAAGGIGQPLSLLLKISPLVNELSLYDIQNVKGVAKDLGHINTMAKVSYYDKKEDLDDALDGAEIVVITAGLPRKPGMTRQDLFKSNANIVKDIAQECSQSCPKALIAVITNPVNSLVPVVAEVMKKAGTYDYKRIFGVTTLDLVRASTFVAGLECLDPKEAKVPVIGGHSALTMVPVLSQAQPPVTIPKDKLEALIHRIQNASDEVVEAKGTGSATLSTAYSAARLVFALCRALNGEEDIIEFAYVKSELTDADYFSTALLLGPNGIKKNLGYGKLNKKECYLLDSAVENLIKEIQKGVQFVKGDKC